MPSTLPLASLHRVAAREGYKGEAADHAAIKSFLLSPDINIPTIEYEGAEIQVKDLDYTPETKAPRKVKAETPTVNADEPTHDIAAKARAGLLAEMKAAGWDLTGGKRPGLANAAGTVTSVKSWQERMYEDRIKDGKAKFATFAQVKCFGDYVRSLSAAAWRRPDDYQTHFKNFAEGYEAIAGKAYATNSASNGAAYVPEVFVPELIKNTDNYGAYAQLTRVIRSNNSQIVLPRNTGSITTYWVGDNTAITASASTLDNVTLTAKKVAALAQASNELLADSAINFADDVMDDLARAIAKIKDQCLLIGDGSFTYGGMTGYDKKFGTIATDGGYVVVGGATADAHTAANLALTIARLPHYALDGAKWTCSQAIFGAVFARLMTSTAVGGLLPSQLAGPVPYAYMGFPIVINNVMNSAVDVSGSSATYAGFTTGDMPDILFGNFERSSKMLDLLDVQLDVDTSYGFNTFSTYFRAVARFHSNVHDVGTSSAAGPVVSLWQT